MLGTLYIQPGSQFTGFINRCLTKTANKDLEIKIARQTWDQDETPPAQRVQRPTLVLGDQRIEGIKAIDELIKNFAGEKTVTKEIGTPRPLLVAVH